MSICSSISHFLLGGVHVVDNILSKTAIEKDRLLTYDTKALSQIMNIVIIEFYSINLDDAFLRIIESEKELNDCGFPASRCAYECTFVSILEFKVEILKQILFS